MSQKQQYPRWMYHKTEPACIVNDPAEEDALGNGWSDKYGGPETAPAAPAAKGKPKPTPPPDDEPEEDSPKPVRRGKK